MSVWSVHPRIRGEHAIKSEQEMTRNRFIPAYAGNTWSEGTWSCRTAVHPRIRGEHSRTDY